MQYTNIYYKLVENTYLMNKFQSPQGAEWLNGLNGLLLFRNAGAFYERSEFIIFQICQ